MGTLDTSIALGVRPVQIDNPLDVQAKRLTLQHLAGQGQLQQLQTQQAQIDFDQQRAYGEALKQGVGPDGQVNYGTTLSALAQSGNGKGYAALLKQQQDAIKASADLGHVNAQTGKLGAETTGLTQQQQITNHTQALQALSSVNSPDAMNQWLLEGARSGALTGDKAAGVFQQLQQNPASWIQVKNNLQQMGQTVQQQIEARTPKLQTIMLGGKSQLVDMNPNTTATGAGMTFDHTVTPDTIANNATSIRTTGMNNATSTANNRATIAKDYNLAGIGPDGKPIDGGGLLDQPTIANAAARYNMDGTLPPNLGRGAQGPREIAAILKEASAQAAARGDTPEAQRIAQLQNKSNAGALNKLTTQQQLIGSFEKNFNKNADIALELSAKTDNTGVPIVNKWVNVGKRAITGDPELAAFDASVKATVNEYAKIVGGGTGGGATAQGEVTKIEGLLSAAQTREQVASVLNLMKRETANRMQAFEDQKGELTSSMNRNKPAPVAAAPGVASPGGAVVPVKSDADYNSLPSGTRFVDPKGNVRVKP